MKIFLLTNASSNQVALASRLHEAIGLASIIVRSNGRRRSSKSRPRFQKLLLRFVAFPISVAWRNMQKHYASLFPTFPISPALEVSDINVSEVQTIIETERPDLVLVSGTNLLKQPLIETIQRYGKVMNLHTGLSPYIRGGPNCTNWCLAIGEPGLIGNAIMWIDSGIDSGNLIATETTDIAKARTLTDLHITVMDHAHDLYVRSAHMFVNGTPLPNVEQKGLEAGRIFFTRQWTITPALHALVTWCKIRTGVLSHRYVSTPSTCIFLEKSD